MMPHIKSCNTTNADSLKIDKACFSVISSSDEVVKIYYQSDECYKCTKLLLDELDPFERQSYTLNSDHPFTFSYKFSNSSSQICNATYRFEEHGIYGWNLTKDCSNVYQIIKPLPSYIPILGILVIFIFLALLWKIIKSILSSEWLNRFKARRTQVSELEDDLGSPSAGADNQPLVQCDVFQIRKVNNRISSLDVFRGISISLMIFVNYGGGHYWYFKHSVWNGLTFADLVFPWFVWIMGMSSAISIREQLRRCVPRLVILKKIFWRSIILIALGIILNSRDSNDLETLRIPGVLQRLGVIYLVTASLEAVFMNPQRFNNEGTRCSNFGEGWVQVVVVLCLVAISTTLSMALQVPGCPKGYLGPGGFDNFSSAENCTGGAAGYIDRLIFGENHLYKYGTFKELYNTSFSFDPEGALGTLSSILLAYFGMHAGKILFTYHYSFSRITQWMLWAILTGIVAGILCDFGKNGGVIPINKNLWSISYSLCMASMSFIMMTLIYILVDERKWWSGAPFSYAGMNSIVIYVGHELTKKLFPWSWKPYYGTHAEFLTMNIWATMIWIIISYILFVKNICIKI